MINLPIDIADEVGCSKHTIYKINKGKRLPSPELAQKIIKAMKERGRVISLREIRPDLADLVANLI